MTREKFDFAIIGGGIVGTYLGRLLARRGRSVALIERGPASLSESVRASPAIICTRRQHAGACQARNHLLGGNGYYWGGGLIRPAHTLFQECVGGEAVSGVTSEDIEASFEAVERELGLHRPPAREAFGLGSGKFAPCDLAEMCVLRGKARNVSLGAIKEIRGTENCEIVSEAELIGFERRRQNPRVVSSVRILHQGVSREILADKIVISAGTIDSNLLVLAHRGGLGISGLKGLGSRLHDHFSLPLFKITIGASSEFRDLVAPRFEKGMIFGRRFELWSERGWGGRGFLHFQFLFDEISPYREIRKLMLLRQQSAGALKMSKAAVPAIGQAATMLRIAFERYFRDRLYIAGKLSVVATLDFESFPHEENRIQLGDSGDATLEWDVHREDELTFKELSEKSGRLVSELSSSWGISFEPLYDLSDQEAVSTYLREKASDAYHLGGGLRINGDDVDDGVVGQDMGLRGVENVYVISCAVFRRPGAINPTHVLLALADRFARRH